MLFQCSSFFFFIVSLPSEALSRHQGHCRWGWRVNKPCSIRPGLTAGMAGAMWGKVSFSRKQQWQTITTRESNLWPLDQQGDALPPGLLSHCNQINYSVKLALSSWVEKFFFEIFHWVNDLLEYCNTKSGSITVYCKLWAMNFSSWHFPTISLIGAIGILFLRK